VTDQTSAHDPLNGYIPQGLTLDEAAELRRRDPNEYVRRSTATMVVHVNAMLALQRAGAVVFDYGNNIRRFAFDAGCADAFLIPGFVPEYIRPLFCTGTRAVPLGRALRRSQRHRPHRRLGARTFSGE
jgi:urocanate hydratase